MRGAAMYRCVSASLRRNELRSCAHAGAPLKNALQVYLT
jgi:hypothetical protein